MEQAVNNELERLWTKKQAVLICYQVLPQHKPKETNINYTKVSSTAYLWSKI
jgi:hypothetical protein